MVAAAILAGCGNDSGRVGVGEVVRVVDGDTVVIELAGSDETVRLLGIDTPETVDPSRPPECFGAEASNRLAELLPPRTEVRLERDVEARDRFGRLLAYLRRDTDELFVNLAMVAEGFAETLVIEPNGAYASELGAAESTARATGAGMWSACSHE